ncbi:hypothetical protein [Desulfitobacterium sp.]|nr:hypothetical protein [Desulfitobacterium sp.]HVJ50667.1 hypothetical protein [Desulfitobacterium sp.]
MIYAAVAIEKLMNERRKANSFMGGVVPGTYRILFFEFQNARINIRLGP